MERTPVTDPIAELRSPHGALVSMYLERPSPGGFSALIADLGRHVTDQAKGRTREVEKSVTTDTDRIRDMADDFEREAVPAYAVFASQVDGILEVKRLAHPVSSAAALGARPYLRPLRSTPRPIRTAFVVADRSKACLFAGFDGAVEALGSPLTVELGKSNYGGFGGYDEHRVRGRAHQMASRMWREAGEVLLSHHQQKPFDLLLVGSHDEMVDDIRSEMHPYLKDLDHAAIQVGPGEATLARLRAELATQRIEFRQRRERALVARLIGSAAQDANAVLGLSAALKAVNSQAVHDLVVAGEFARPGALCPSCGFLARRVGECAVCGAAMGDVDDIVSSAMDATVAAGGQAHQLMIGSRLDSHGIGALTRFPVAVRS